MYDKFKEEEIISQTKISKYRIEVTSLLNICNLAVYQII